MKVNKFKYLDDLFKELDISERFSELEEIEGVELLDHNIEADKELYQKFYESRLKYLGGLNE